MAHNIAILFITGSYSLPAAYQSFIDAISKAGYEINTPHLPTVGLRSREGRPGQGPSMYDDADLVSRELADLVDRGKDVVLIGHSYGGIPMSQATKGFSKKERQAQGKAGGVVHLAYYSALVPPLGGSAESLLSTIAQEKRPPISIDADGWMLIEDPAATAAMVCQDMPGDDAAEYVRGFTKHSARSFMDKLTYAGYEDIPSSWLLTEQDLAGPPPFQREMIATIEKASGAKVDVTSIQGSHICHVVKEKEFYAWVMGIIGKLGE
ncbi:hypothetical protein ANO11243_061790 [Dothideomycetidae sp. 11243]|nr:hypothetical protein ANO11243_061790 [fungal sp. No.11243]